MFALVFFWYIITICTSYMCIYVLCVRLTFVYHVFFFNAIHMYIKLYSSGPCNYISIYIYILIVCIYIYIYATGWAPSVICWFKNHYNPINYS